MRIHGILCGAALATALAFPASAQDQSGQYAEALSRIIEEARAGNCSELMTAGVQLACQRRIQQIALTLERFGPVQKITLLKSEEKGGSCSRPMRLGSWTGSP